MLLCLIPGTFLACLLLIGMIGSGFKQGFQIGYAAAALVLLIPPFLIAWGLRMLKKLRQGFHQMLRRQLLAYYLVVWVYCALWLFSTVSHSGHKTGIFPVEIQIAGGVILVIPVFITLFTSPGEKRVWKPGAGGNIRLHRRSDCLVAWLASHVR